MYIVAYGDEVYQKFKQDFLCIEQPASPQLDDNDEQVDGAAAVMDSEPHSNDGPIIRIVAADQLTASCVETELREQLDKLFIRATVKNSVVKLLQPYDTFKLKSISGSAEEVSINIGECQ